MKRRIAEMLPDQKPVKKLNVSTFHSLGMRILRTETETVGLRYGFSIIDPRDAMHIIADLARVDVVSGKDLIERIHQRISDWKNQGVAPEKVTLASSEYLLACNSVDLDDLLFMPVRLIKDNATVREKWQRKIKYLLVDEYQDTNGVQYELIRLLAGPGKRLTVVGDDDQSIYAWRGARVQNLVQLKRDYPDLEVIKLEQNYRSCGRILKIANHVIRHNPRPFEKSLWSDLGYGDPVEIFQAHNEEHEAEKVVSSILRHRFQHQSRHGDFAILYRSNHQARVMEIKLREMHIPYKLSGGYSFFDRAEIRDVTAYLRLLTNPADDSAFLRIINIPRRGIGATTLEKIANLAKASSQSLFETLFDSRLNRQIQTKQSNSLREFGLHLKNAADQAQQGEPIAAVRGLLSDIGFERWLKETGKADAAEARWENVLTLIDWLENSPTRSEGTPTLSELVNTLILNDILDQRQEDQNQDVVNLMTLHASKGLEFKNIYIIGVEEDILPHRVSVEEDAIEEERRLFYVGLTRAMARITLSYSARRKRFGEIIDCEPSRFLKELPEEEIVWNKLGQAHENDQQNTGKSHLASIRAARAQSG